MSKKGKRERREMLEQMQQTKPQRVRLDELQERMQERAKAARECAPVIAAKPKRAWWQRLFGWSFFQWHEAAALMQEPGMMR
jgi:hypothetical protein